MNSKHTPGPWVFYADTPSVDPNWHIVTTDNKLRVLANVHIEPGNAMDEANARLIAASPQLLTALQTLRSFVAVMVGRGPDATIPATVATPLGVHVKIGDIMSEVEAAIAKAEGK